MLGQCPLGPLQGLSRELAVLRIGRKMIPNGSNPVVEELWGLLCQALGSSQPGLAHGLSPLTHRNLEAATPER